LSTDYCLLTIIYWNHIYTINSIGDIMITTTALIKQLFKGFDMTQAALVTRILGIVDSKLGGKEKISMAREKTGASLALLNEV
jgi:hypothetical protein